MMNDKDVAAMAEWTLEDIQNNPLGAVEQVRELAAAYIALSQERNMLMLEKNEVTEVCPHCESEITMIWDVAQQGYKAFCPVCGKRIMLCDMCLHPEDGEGSCDYDSKTDTCKHNGGGGE